MSDAVIITAMLCITSISIIGITAISTYFKDKIEMKVKTNVKNIIDNEVAIGAENQAKK